MLIGSKQSEETPTIELTPVIDVVFLLLIFFLVATTFHQSEREMQIALPEAETGGPISMALRDIVVNVTGDGSIWVDGRQVAPAELQDVIAAAVERNSDQKVTIRGDRAATYAHIVRALDACKAGGVQEPYLDTVPTS